MNARNTAAFLNFIVKINPQASDALFPHGPVIARAGREYLVAHVIKGFASELNNRALKTRLARIQLRLVESAAQSLVADYDDENWCPTPPPIPGPFPDFDPNPVPWRTFSEVMLNPQPLPPKERPREIGGYLLMLSEVTSLDDVAMELRSIGNGLLGIRSSSPTRSNVPLPQRRSKNVRALVETGI